MVYLYQYDWSVIPASAGPLANGLVLTIVVSVLALAWLLYRLRTRFRGREDPAEHDRRLMMQMGELHRQGGLSDEEFRSIKSRLIETVDDSTRSSGPPR